MAIKEIKILSTAYFGKYQIIQFDDMYKTIRVLVNGQVVADNNHAAVRSIAEALSIKVLNSSGNPKDTYTLGAEVIYKINSI